MVTEVKILSLSAKFHLFSCDQQLIEWSCPSVCPSVCLSVRPSQLFDYVPMIECSWYFNTLFRMITACNLPNFEVVGQRARSRGSKLGQIWLKWGKTFSDENSNVNSDIWMKLYGKLQLASEVCCIVFEGHGSKVKVTQSQNVAFLARF